MQSMHWRLIDITKPSHVIKNIHYTMIACISNSKHVIIYFRVLFRRAPYQHQQRTLAATEPNRMLHRLQDGNCQISIHTLKMLINNYQNSIQLFTAFSLHYFKCFTVNMHSFKNESNQQQISRRIHCRYLLNF